LRIGTDVRPTNFVVGQMHVFPVFPMFFRVKTHPTTNSSDEAARVTGLRIGTDVRPTNFVVGRMHVFPVFPMFFRVKTRPATKFVG
jgi:hypothetical protein